jgi:hypothetical protein
MKEIIQDRTDTLSFDGLNKLIFLHLPDFVVFFLSSNLEQNEHLPADSS